MGEVKEKEQAHREYKEAIEQGHGAYLLDNEGNDVFRVSVGNLLPGSKAIIKITYITELGMEGPMIQFQLPATLVLIIFHPFVLL